MVRHKYIHLCIGWWY